MTDKTKIWFAPERAAKIFRHFAGIITPDYWPDYHMGTREILTILIFIPAFERDDFFDYKW